MCQTFLPLMRCGGRLVSLSSVASDLKHYSEPTKARFRDERMTLEDLERIASDFEVCKTSNRTDHHTDAPRRQR